MTVREMFIIGLGAVVGVVAVGVLLDRGSAEVPESLLWSPSDDDPSEAADEKPDPATKKDEAMPEVAKRDSKLPPIDLTAPKEFETVTFALG